MASQMIKSLGLAAGVMVCVPVALAQTPQDNDAIQRRLDALQQQVQQLQQQLAEQRESQ
ncbi:hypothetical protein [Salinicola halimionae]|uniref:hypothetical protein n=1 Tax=Salinicola halimionae TaxID=1949081 RepID=UPI001FD9B055|nr:hypothetical protein [Salinicola halimionae]